MTRQLWVIGYPSDVGGANTELWHTVKLWRRYGWGVRCVPTWRAEPAWERRLDAIGVETVQCQRRVLQVDPGSVCVAFCNGHFEGCAHQLRKLNCRLVYVPCMCYLNRSLLKDHAAHGPFDAYVFQSSAQMTALLPGLSAFGVKPRHCRLIRGAFDVDEFSFRPRERRPGPANAPFVVGRLSRTDPHKFSRYTWQLYRSIRKQVPETQVRIMGWRERIAEKTGLAPGWAETLRDGAETPQAFLRSLHCLCGANDDRWNNQAARENWPRVGLEAMAAGVPIVAEKRGGWREMIIDGETGFLGDSIESMAASVVRLAQNETLRHQIVRNAREAVVQLADPETIVQGWETLLTILS